MDDVLRDDVVIGGQNAETVLKLGELDENSQQGRELHESMRYVLRNLGLENENILTLSDIRDEKRIRLNAAANGDGVIPPSAAQEDNLKAFIQDIMDTAGSVDDVNGEKGGYRRWLAAVYE